MHPKDSDRKANRDFTVEQCVQKGVDGIANSVNPDQTGSMLFAKTCLSESLGSLSGRRKNPAIRPLKTDF